MRILGIDPGKKGGFAIYDTDWEAVSDIWDMPTYSKKVGTGKAAKDRPEIDKVGLVSLFNKFGRPDMTVMELVGQRPTAPKDGQARAQSGMFEFGKGWGYVDMLLTVYKHRTEYARPQVWKKSMACPADKKEAVFRADQLLPDHRDLWRGSRGGPLDGRAEAALLALYGATKLTLH
jgi:hypothetical protein